MSRRSLSVSSIVAMQPGTVNGATPGLAPLSPPLHETATHRPGPSFDLEFDMGTEHDAGSQQQMTGVEKTKRAALCVVLWYIFSISLSVYNKWMFSEAFRMPIMTTALHQFVQTFLALAAVRVLRLRAHMFDASSLPDFTRRVGPTVLASTADIGLGNSSLQVIPLSFYTMVKSSALGFVLLFSILFGLEQPSWRLAGIIGVLSVGVFMMVQSDDNGSSDTGFNWLGLFLVLGAACASGLRWALVKILLLGAVPFSSSASAAASAGMRHLKKPHPVQMVLAISPGMFIALSVWGCIVEGPHKFISADLWTQHPVPVGIVLLLVPGALAFCMTWSEFELLNVTGPLTLAIAGICKEVATIIVSMLVFQDALSLVNVFGLGVTILAIAIYHHYRHSVADEKRSQ